MDSNTQHNAPDSRNGQDGLADMAMTSNSHEELSQESERRYTVGVELRMAREERGLQIRDVVDAVRIQTRYLEALEDGRIEDLPGTVYALGFVRTYAEYLGLDGSEMVSRFKEEGKGLQSQEYVLPEPIDEGKVPTAAIIIIAILLTGVAYGAWHFLYRSDAPVAGQVPDVPERLAALVPPEEQQESAAAGPIATPAEENPEPAAVPEPQPPQETPPQDAPPLTAAEPAPPVAEELPAQPAPAVVETPPAPEPEPAPAEPVQAEAAPPAVQPTPEPQPEVAVEVPAPPAGGSESVAELETAAPPSPPAEPVSREPRVFGADNPDARIVINAEEDAWVEVTDSDGALLFSRVLRRGDSYRVPDRPGAVFVTGNAGGLAIVVDGEAAPPVGPAGVVRRNVRLDPDQLRAGTAWP